MLVLSRKKGESILVGENIEIIILDVAGDVLKVGIKAPSDISILRKELYLSVEEMNIHAEQSGISAQDLESQFSKIKNKKSL